MQNSITITGNTVQDLDKVATATSDAMKFLNGYIPEGSGVVIAIGAKHQSLTAHTVEEEKQEIAATKGETIEFKGRLYKPKDGNPEAGDLVRITVSNNSYVPVGSVRMVADGNGVKFCIADTDCDGVEIRTASGGWEYKVFELV